MALEEFDWVDPFKLEMKVAGIISTQAKHGTNFKKRNAHWHIYSLSEKIVSIDKIMIPLLPQMMNKGTTYKKPFKINGQFQKWPGEYAQRVGLEREDVAGPFSAVWYTPFDSSKSDRVKQVMLDLGWIPTEWNEKKMPFDIWSYRKRLERGGLNKFMEGLSRDEREGYNEFLEGFIKKHFKNKTVTYMRTILMALGFKKNQRPSFGDIKKKLLLKQYWPSSPKITEDSFDSVGEEHGLVMQLLKDRMVWSHRRSLIQGLVDQTRTDCKLEGQLNPCATPTARGRHRIIVNIPAAYATFGPQCRSLFVGDSREYEKPLILRRSIKEGMRLKKNTNILQEWNEDKKVWKDAGTYRDFIPRNQDVFVGGDGAGLELRMLTHYLIFVPKLLLKEAQEQYDAGEISKDLYAATKRKFETALKSAEEYREQLLFGDIHTHNQKLAGLPTRNAAKTFIYSFLYGAGDAKLGVQLGGGKDVGAELRERFLAECPCIPVLIEWVQDFAGKHGWVPAIDGRKLWMRTEDDGKVATRKALNTLLQAAGSIVMKFGMCFLNNWVKRDKLRCHQVIFYHDEFQYTCHREDVEKLRFHIDNCIRVAGEYLKMECPLASDSLAGSSWFRTH